jgi:hypothetical protein
MGRHTIAVLIFSVMILAGSAQIGATDIPVEPYVDASFATNGPLSLCNSPNGGGKPFTQAFAPNGQMVDGTLTITLYDEIPPFGNPVPNYPKEDIWLEDLFGGIVFPVGGTIPDENTDEFGVTYWTQPLHAGGYAEPVDGNQFVINVSGWILHSPALSDFRANSPDINGDLMVNLVDIARFASAYFARPYDYATDFNFDGLNNLEDIVILAASI